MRIHARRYIVGSPMPDADGRVFTCAETGTEMPLSQRAILQMMRDARMTTDAAFRLLPASVLENLEIPLDAFSTLERESGEAKYPFVAAVNDLPVKFQGQRKHLQSVIDRLMADPAVRTNFKRPPTTRRVRTWFIRWIITARDIRALIDNHRAKGNRTDRLPGWMRERIKSAIDRIYRNEIAGTKAQAWRIAESMVLVSADEMGVAVPNLGQKRAIGRNIVSRIIDRMEGYDLTRARHGKRKADRIAKTIRVGPNGDYPLGEVEVDHTLMDWMVVDDRGRVLGRPWLTVLIDRFSRMIIGFHVGFHPPCWTSLMEAIRMGVSVKEELLAGIARNADGADFHSDWPCYGAPDFIFCDNGREFRSTSIKATEAALNTKILDLPRASGWLKGKVESWFKTANENVIHIAPGTTKSNPKARGNYKSEEKAVLTLHGARWVITKWIVDIYHTEVHPETNEVPLKRWTRGVNEVGPRLPVSSDLLVPLTGLTDKRALRSGGISFRTLHYSSNELSALQNRLGYNAIVEIRIDPFDISKIFVLDPHEQNARIAWKEGLLDADDATAKMTLHQFEVTKKAYDEHAWLDANDPEAALSRAKAWMEIIAFFDRERKPGKGPGRGVARLVTDGRNASEHLRQPRHDPEESARPLTPHDPEVPSTSEPPDERGPYRRPSMPEAPPPPEDGWAGLQPDDDDHPSPSGEDPTPNPTLPGRMAVRRRKL